MGRWAILVVVSAVPFVLASPAWAALNFSAPAPFGVGGSSPSSVAIADLNGDANPDLATANQLTDNVSVLLGDGAGGLAPAPGSPFGAGDVPAQAKLGRLDGDANLDLAVPNVFSSNVSILLGNGDGTFDPATNIATSSAPRSIAIGDLDNNGTRDLVVARNSPEDWNILLGNGDGTFDPPTTFDAGNTGVEMVLKRLDANDTLDLVSANSSSHDVSVLLGNGDGTFGAADNIPVGMAPLGVAVADLDGNATRDIAATNGSDDDVSVLLGDGAGGFGGANDFPVGDLPQGVVIHDLERPPDGVPDLAVANRNSGNVSVLRGDGDGTFAPAVNFPAGDTPFALGTAHFSADRRRDLAVANLNAGTVSLLYNGAVIRVPRQKWTYRSRAVGTQSPLQTFRIENVGAAPVTIASVVLGGASPGQFALENDQCSAAIVAPGDSCTLQARFAPTLLGAHQATIEITHNAPGSPHHITLKGTGT
jgi:hypothetical protein